MLKFELVPKWVWMLLAGAVVLGIYGSVRYGINEWNTLVANNVQLAASNKSVLATNKFVVQTLLDERKDRALVADLNKELVQSKDELKTQMSSLDTQLDAEISKRKEAERLGKQQVCVDPNPGPPVETNITWQAYCKASSDPACNRSK